MTAFQSQMHSQFVLAKAIDSIALADPLRVFSYAPRSASVDDGWEHVSYGQLANAINNFAHDLDARKNHTNSATKNTESPTLVYIGPSDVRYIIVLVGSIKAGWRPFFTSPRNSIEGQMSLFNAVCCNTIYHAASYAKIVSQWTGTRDMETVEIPELSAWLSSAPKPFPYNRTFDQARFDPLTILHTSGSTGTPKPIIVRQGSLAIMDAFMDWPDLDGAKTIYKHWATACKKLFLPLPMFHAAGLITTLAQTVCGSSTVVSAPDRPLTAELAVQCITTSGADGAFLPPSTIEEIATTEQGIATLVSLKILLFGGGPLSRDVGDLLVSRGVMLHNGIGSTESFPYSLHVQRLPELWHYFVIDAEPMGAEWRPVSDLDDIYELHIRRKAEDPGVQSIFYTFPELWEWSTGDMFRKHPTLPNHWSYYGRHDNIIVFSNGEKLNPITIEETVSRHPSVRGALVAGQQRFQPALILEPAVAPENRAQVEALIDVVWPVVQEANANTVSHGRISRRMIMVADGSKPFPRAGKGTIQRSHALKLYEKELEALFQYAKDLNSTGAIELDVSSQNTLTEAITSMIAVESDCGTIDPDTDFFTVGLNSLQVINISRQLGASLKKAAASFNTEAVAPRAIYANPTSRQLAAHIQAAIDRGHDLATEEDREAIENARAIEALVSKYTKNLPPPNKEQRVPFNEGQTVLITGTTGSLGAYLLDSLCRNPRVDKIYALNRGKDGGQARQLDVSTGRGLGTDFAKVGFLGIDLSEPSFGLHPKQYEEMMGSADRIIHNAWPVNFNMSVSSFEPYIRGVRHLADFANAANKNVPIVFVSTLGTVQGWKSLEPVPEARLEDLNLAQMGYSRSKLAASLVLDAAVEASGVSAASIRVGQIAGPRGEKGFWNKQEFLPSLIASSVHLGVLPREFAVSDVVDWMAVEDVAEMILDIAGINATLPVSQISGYFHCVNPNTTTWQALAVTIQSFYKDRIRQLVSLDEWVRALQASALDAGSSNLDKNPAVKLIDTYVNMVKAQQSGFPQVRLCTDRTKTHSPTMARWEAVTPELMKHWCKQWGF